MKEILVISGKGGTGKTTIVASLAYLLEGPLVLADADVEASNLPLLLDSKTIDEESFRAGWEPKRDQEKCSSCGLCREKCRFGAIQEDLSIDLVSCEGCGVCAWFCPEGAIEMEEKEVGRVFLSSTRYGPLVHAYLYPGEENSGKLVSFVKRRARQIAEGQGYPLILVDGSPGVGCPVIASLAGVDWVLIVTEPTISALHDLERLICLIKHFRLPGSLVLNKADLSWEVAQRIITLAEREGFPLWGQLPYDKDVLEALHQGQPLPAVSKGPLVDGLAKIAWRLRENL